MAKTETRKTVVKEDAPFIQTPEGTVDPSTGEIVEKGLELGIILNLTAQKVVRLAPPINISSEQWEKGLDLVVETIAAAAAAAG